MAYNASSTFERFRGHDTTRSSTATNYLGLCIAPVFITDTCRALAVYGMRDSIRPIANLDV
jgi:hypothetical protein